MLFMALLLLLPPSSTGNYSLQADINLYLQQAQQSTGFPGLLCEPHDWVGIGTQGCLAQIQRAVFSAALTNSAFLCTATLK